MAYTDTTQVSNFLQRALTSYETAELPNLIAAVKKWLDTYLSSTFDVVSSSTRYYDGGVRNLSIDPCTEITEVKSVSDDGSSSYIYTLSTEYIAEPQNQTVKNELRKRISPFPHGIARVAVTAKFSEYDGAVPSDIQIVATRLVAALINSGKQADISGTGIKSESLEGHSVTYITNSGGTQGGESLEGIANADPTVKAILDSRRDLLVDNYDVRNDDDDYMDGGGLIL